MPEKKRKLNFNEVKQVVEKHIRTAYGKGIHNFQITYAKQEDNLWRINVEFKEKGHKFIFKSACLTLDAVNGEVKEFYKDRFWRF